MQELENQIKSRWIADRRKRVWEDMSHGETTTEERNEEEKSAREERDDTVEPIIAEIRRSICVCVYIHVCMYM